MEKWLLSLDDLFDRWMYPFGNGKYTGYLQRSGQIIVARLRGAVEANQKALIGHYCLELEDYARANQHSPELAEVLAHCARVKAAFGELQPAEAMLREARLRYEPSQHCRAVTSMMLGSLLWRLNCRQEEAISAWTECEKSFSELAKSILATESEVDWYCHQSERINVLITWGSHVLARRSTHWKDFYQRRYLQNKSFTSRTRSKRSVWASSAGQQPPASAPSLAETQARGKSFTWQELLSEDYLNVYEVSTSIPAGGFRITDGDPTPVGEVHVPLVLINNRLFKVINLRKYGGHEVNLAYIHYPAVVLVVGESMDDYPILDGDFVLINPEQQPQNGDVVLASLANPRSGKFEETLKIYREEQDRIVLLSKSKNAQIPREWFSVTKADLASGRERLDIRGVALARFTAQTPYHAQGGNE